MTARLRKAAHGDWDDLQAPRATNGILPVLGSGLPPRLRVVLADTYPCHPNPLVPRDLSADHDPAAKIMDAALAGRSALVVDDEPMILEILVEHCASLGMEVCEAANGEGALKQIEACPGIEVLVTDVRMPGLDGPALVKRALALRPSMKVIFVTGYTTHRSTAWPILRKPFDLDELEAALRQALMQPSPTSE